MVDTVEQVAVPAHLAAVGALRRSVEKILADWAEVQRRCEIVLAVSELGTNAIQAQRDPGSVVTLRARNLDDCIVIEIEDCGPGFADESRPIAEDDEEHGRGLRVVQALADELSVERHDGRTTVRCAFSKN